MAKYYVDCEKCGTEFRINLLGKGSYRQWKLENTEWICDDCKQKEREELNELSKAENKENGFPALNGSEKQVAWAETIRKKFYDKTEKILPKINQEPSANFIEKIEIDNPSDKIEQLFLKDSASFWIDNRTMDIVNLINSMPNSKEVMEKDIEISLQKEAELEATIRPAVALSETIAYIFMDSNEKLCIEFPEKREDFRTLVKTHGFSWGNGRWYRNLSVTTGTKEDRMAEMGNLLLTEGFVVRIFDEEIRTRAIEGIYEAEHTRWVKVYKGKFSIKWKRYSEDFYEEARKIPTSKWDNPTVDVKAEQFEAIEDFANEYDFRFTPKALELLEEARATKEAQLVPTVKKGKESTEAPSIEKDFTPQEDGKIDEALLD